MIDYGTNPMFDTSLKGHHIFIEKSKGFPDKIYAHVPFSNDQPILYVRRKFADVIIVMDDEHAVGHCYCSFCKKSIEQFDNYCSHCGAKIKEKKVLGEDNA